MQCLGFAIRCDLKISSEVTLKMKVNFWRCDSAHHRTQLNVSSAFNPYAYIGISRQGNRILNVRPILDMDKKSLISDYLIISF